MSDARLLRQRLSSRQSTPEDVLTDLIPLAASAPIRASRVDAARLVGEIAGRAFDAPWPVAERAAWVLLDLARHADGRAERLALLGAIGRGFRNLWLMPFVHARLDDDDAEVVAAAIAAAGGLGFPALEEAVASRFLAAEAAPALRRAAIAALGRMGAVSAAGRLAAFVDGEPGDAAAALTALAEIRADAAVAQAVALLDGEPPGEVEIAAVRYLAELGREQVLPSLRRLARDDDADKRVAAGLAARAYKAERTLDASERILAALTEQDRAVRAQLARRLRTLPIAGVLGPAAELLGEDPVGVIQIVGEVRVPEVTRFLLELSRRADLPAEVRARALGSVEPNEPWERAALAEVATSAAEEPLRAAAARTLGAFAQLDEVLRDLAPLGDDPAPSLRGALLWALQLAARPRKLEPELAARLRKQLERGLADDDAAVRRRAAYVAGNLRLPQLAAPLLELARREDKAPDLRVAACTGLAELAEAGTLDGLVALLKREEDPEALAACSRALAAGLLAHPEARVDLSRVQAKVALLLKSDSDLVRAAAARVAGLAAGAISPSLITPLAGGGPPRVREAAIGALGRLRAAEGEATLLGAMDDPDPAIHERAAEALLSLGGRRATERLLEYASGDEAAAARARIAARIEVPGVEGAHFLPLVNAALGRLRPDDPAWEALVAMKVRLLEERGGGAGGGEASIDAAIVALFPTYARLSKVRGFEALNRSLRTAEGLYRGAAGGALAGEGADYSPPIMLWMKTLEGYVHAWLAPHLSTLQRQPHDLCVTVEHLLADAWPSYQRFLGERWLDPVEMGPARVEVPLRAQSSPLRDFQERRVKRLDSPLSVTEWGRMMIFFAVDHPSGVRNLFRVSSKSADQVVRVAHRLQSLAAVRNLVTHRATAAADTLEAFRRAYYTAFEDLTRLA